MTSPENASEPPLAYFITFSCYGARLRGDSRGSVDCQNNQYGKPFLSPNQRRARANLTSMKYPRYQLDEARRCLVLQAIEEVCRFRGWQLLAAHVRTRHVHSVVAADPAPEEVMNTLKTYASRRLNRSGLDPFGQKRWSRHGSTVYLWTPGLLESAIDYVINRQGLPMALFTPRNAGSGAAR